MAKHPGLLIVCVRVLSDDEQGTGGSVFYLSNNYVPRYHLYITLGVSYTVPKR